MNPKLSEKDVKNIKQIKQKVIDSGKIVTKPAKTNKK